MPNDEEKAPGLEWRSRPGGQRTPYWVARKDLRDAGYTPRTVNLWHLRDDPEGLRARCGVLDAEQLEWAKGNVDDLTYDGTFNSLFRIFQQHEDSPYHEKRQDTRRTYDEGMAIVSGTMGGLRITQMNGVSIKREYKKWIAPTKRSKGLPRLRQGKKGIQGISVALAFGAALMFPGCRALRDAILSLEWPNGASRKTAMSFAQASAFVDEAIERGDIPHALAQAIQFECTLRQKDVIGEWEKVGPEAGGAFLYKGKRWDRGLVWGTHIDRDLILTKETSKNGALARFDLKRHELVMRVLRLVPNDKRVGPVIMHETAGRPFLARYFSATWREIATAAGIPEEVWNMDSRAGGITETIDSGISIEQARKQATHANISTTVRYDRAVDDTTVKIADARARYRKNSVGTSTSNALPTRASED